MATRFAVASTPWNTPSTWDNGAVPLAGDTVYPNGFTVPIDTNISVASLNNSTSNVYLPNMSIPAMTSNTTPSGVAFAVQNNTTAFQVFDQSSPSWSSGIANVGIIGYQFTSQKIIRQYRWTADGSYTPRNFVLEGSNDGINYLPVHSVTLNATNVYNSGVIPNTTLYSYYRLNVSTTISGNGVILYSFEMTESTTTSYGAFTGGSFTVPSSLVGTRNIEFTGAGLMGNQAATTILSLNNNLTNTVNLNKTSGAYIINPLYNVTDGANTIAILINNNGIVNFNGDIYGTTTNGVGNSNGIIRVVSNPTITVNGNLYPIAGRNGAATYLFNLLTSSTNATLTINGSIFGSNLWSAAVSIYSQAVNTINVNGDIISNAGSCITSINTVYLTVVGNISYTNASSVTPVSLAIASTVTMTGTITAPPNAAGIICGSGAINILTGIVTAGTNAVGISAPSATLVTTGVSPLINNNNYMAVYAPKIRFYTGAQVEWTFQTSTGGTKILRNADGSSGLPSFTNVKIGQPFGPNNDIIGACVIPPANTVGVGIPVSTITPINTPVPVTVGTSQLTGEDLLTAISTSSNVVAQRIKNLATVETTGDQLAAFNRI